MQLTKTQLKILRALSSSSKYPTGVKKLANMFGMTTRSIRENLTQLRGQYPIVATYGNGYYICKSKREIMAYMDKIQLHIKKEQTLLRKMRRFL